MANAWIEYIKKISKETGKSFKDAMSIASDRKKNGNSDCMMTKTSKKSKTSKRKSKKNKSAKKRKNKSSKRR
jgi:hypothetical protein